MFRMEHERVEVAIPSEWLRGHVRRDEQENPDFAIGRSHLRQDRPLYRVVELGAIHVLARPEHQIRACAVKLPVCLKVKRMIR